MSAKKLQVSPRNEDKKKSAVINVEFYNSDSQFLKPAANNGRKFEFNFYASKLFHSGMTVSGPGQFWGCKDVNDEELTTKQLIGASALILWLFIVCSSSGGLAAYILFMIIDDKSLNRPEYIIFILVGMVMISLSLWSGAAFMRRCHTLGTQLSKKSSSMSSQEDQVLENA